jgi:hypothetical protein
MSAYFDSNFTYCLRLSSSFVESQSRGINSAVVVRFIESILGNPGVYIGGLIHKVKIAMAVFLGMLTHYHYMIIAPVVALGKVIRLLSVV